MQSGNIIPSQSAASSLTSVPIDLGDLKGYSVTVNFTGADVAGTLKLQARNFTDENWVDVGSSSQAVTSSADHVWSVSEADYRYVRVSWTYSSGTGNIKANYVAKENFVKGA